VVTNVFIHSRRKARGGLNRRKGVKAATKSRLTARDRGGEDTSLSLKTLEEPGRIGQRPNIVMA